MTTPTEHAQRIRQLELELEKADFGLALPRDAERVRELRAQLEQARKEAANARSYDRWLSGERP